MNEAVLILRNMRGGCATVGNTVHTLFRVSRRTTADAGGVAVAAVGPAIEQPAARGDRD